MVTPAMRCDAALRSICRLDSLRIGTIQKAERSQQEAPVKARIALFLPSLGGGGAEQVMAILANAFAERGFAVDLVLAKAEGPYLDQIGSQIRIVDLGRRRVAMCLPALVRYLRRERPTTLISALNYVNVIAILAHRLARVPTRLVVSEHSILSRYRTRDLRGRLVPMLMRITYPLADSVVCVSKGVARDLGETIGLDLAKTVVIYNPVDIDSIDANAHEPLDHPWFQPGAPPVVLAVGRLTEAKDFSSLIRAFALLKAQRPARLMILGEGELRGELEALIAAHGLSDDVALPGYVTNPFAYMKRSAVFVLSSRWEGFGLVLVEAMACDTPVVSTDCPSGPAEILEDGKWGTLVQIGDEYSMAEAIGSVLDETSHPDVRQRAKHFDVHIAARRYIDVLGLEA
jgi:glycosyltransferase involved in cell wall biosynthesis